MVVSLKRVLVVGLSLACASAFGDVSEYYVDSEKGVDDAEHDGTSPAKAKKTLAAAMAIEGLKSGDIVTALPGRYEKGEMSANRVSIPKGVTLRSRDGAEKTFIIGRAATEPFWAGCGTNSLRCAYLANSAKLVGFTLTGGYATMTSASDTTGSTQGGAVSCATGGKDVIGRVVDCIITNNFAVTGGAGIYGRYERCYIRHNACKSYSYGLYGYSSLYIYDSLIASEKTEGSAYAVFSFNEIRNSTIVQGGHNNTLLTVNGGIGTAQMYDCILIGSSMGTANLNLHHCILSSKIDGAAAKVASSTLCPDGDCVVMDESDMMLDEHFRPKSGSPLIDAGLNAAHTTDATTDAWGVPRILNGTIDIGYAEYDWRPEFGRTLDADGDVTVVSATSGVTLDEENAFLRLTTSNETETLTVDWRHAAAFETVHSFKAKVDGTGTLAVYRGDESEPYRTVTAADGVTLVSTAASSDIRIRLVYTRGTDDTAGAAVSSFSNGTKIQVAVEHGGVTLSGDVTAAGTVYVRPGQTGVFTVSRSFDSFDYLCTGIMSNGVFYAFDDYPDGLAFSVDGDDSEASVSVEAVYAPSPITTWYVDPTNGVDTAYGTHPSNARKTLKGAMEIPNLASGHTVVALPGVYDREQMGTSRVSVPAGVTLRSRDGAAKTFIVGAADTVSPVANADGCGPNSIRCVYLASKSQLIGFTVTGGRAKFISKQSYEEGGGICGAAESSVAKCSRIIDCVIVDNRAHVSAGACAGAYVRCRVENNANFLAGYCSGLSGWNKLFVYDCAVRNNSGAYQVYSPKACVNTTIGPGGDTTIACGGGGADGHFWNTVVIGQPHTLGNADFYNCVFSWKDCTVVPGTGRVDAGCRVLTADELMVDEKGAPLKGSPLIDTGTNTYHSTPPLHPPTWAVLDTDVNGGQRIYNACIDVGGYEYDWREDYSADLGRRTTVTDATAGVTETDGKVRLSDGDTLVAEVRGEIGKSCSLPVVITGSGTLTVSRKGETVATLQSGDTSLDLRLAAAVDELSFAFVGEGCADLGKLTGIGLQVLIR